MFSPCYLNGKIEVSGASTSRSNWILSPYGIFFIIFLETTSNGETKKKWSREIRNALLGIHQPGEGLWKFICKTDRMMRKSCLEQLVRSREPRTETPYFVRDSLGRRERLVASDYIMLVSAYLFIQVLIQNRPLM